MNCLPFWNKKVHQDAVELRISGTENERLQIIKAEMISTRLRIRRLERVFVELEHEYDLIIEKTRISEHN